METKKKEIKESAIAPIGLPPNEKLKREELGMQRFMDDMQFIGNQVRDRSLNKPTFLYGDLAVTNYLLWLMLAELMMLNNKEGNKNA